MGFSRFAGPRQNRADQHAESRRNRHLEPGAVLQRRIPMEGLGRTSPGGSGLLVREARHRALLALTKYEDINWVSHNPRSSQAGSACRNTLEAVELIELDRERRAAAFGMNADDPPNLFWMDPPRPSPVPKHRQPLFHASGHRAARSNLRRAGAAARRRVQPNPRRAGRSGCKAEARRPLAGDGDM